MDNVVNTAPSENPLAAAGDPDKGKLKGGKLDKVGKIEDKINLADEYLELFKDIAEGKAINNIVSLTPNLQVNNTFEDTAGSVLSKVLHKIGDLSNVSGYAENLNDFVLQSLNAPSRDEVSVSKEIRENVTVSQYRSSQTSNTYKSEPKIYFTGDIHKDVDVNDIVKAITQELADEQDRSVEGVYK